jgi:hypothetical protein
LAAPFGWLPAIHHAVNIHSAPQLLIKPAPPAVRSFLRLVAVGALALALPCISPGAGIGQASFTAARDSYIQRGTCTDFGAATTFLAKRDRIADGGASRQLEWSDSLGSACYTAEVATEPVVPVSTSKGIVRITLPEGVSGKRFIRIAVAAPQAE